MKMALLNKKTALLLIFSAFLASTALSGCSKSDKLLFSGTVESTQIDITSEVSGKVLKIDKDEGAAIKKDDVVATIDATSQELNVRQYEAVVKAKEAKLEELKAGSRNEQIKQQEAAVEAAKAAVNSSKASVDNSYINYNYWLDKYNKSKSLANSGASAENDLTEAQYRLDTANQQLISAQKQLDSSHSQLQSSQAQLELLRNGATNQAIRASEAELEQSQAALEQAKLTLGKFKIKSPIDGTYIVKNVNIGDMVNTGTSVGKVSDLKDLWIKIYIPQRNLNLVSVNQSIDLTSAALPSKIIKGKVVFVASEAEFTPKNTETAEAKENTVFKVKISIQDNIDILRPGMTVDAHIPSGG